METSRLKSVYRWKLVDVNTTRLNTDPAVMTFSWFARLLPLTGCHVSAVLLKRWALHYT